MARMFFSSFANVTFVLVFATLAIVLVRGSLAKTLIRDVINRRMVVSVIVIGSILQAAFGLYKGYVVPRDVMQDLISAREYLAGRSPYPQNMTDIFVETVRRSPPGFSVVARWPERKEQEDQARLEAASSHWVQAHPPVMTLIVTPLVAAFGFAGTYFVLTALSVACLAITYRLIVLGLDFQLSRSESIATGFALLGWTATVTLIRNGQTGLILECLLVSAWYCLKHGRSAVSGLLVATAASIKLYPGLELAYLWHRHRLAYLTALATMIVIVLGSAILCGWHSFAEYAETAREVVLRYADYPTNYSLLGVLVRWIRLAGGAHDQAVVVYVTLAAFMVLGSVWLTRTRSDQEVDPQSIDIGYALFMALIPLLSPVSWDHYQVILIFPIAVVWKHLVASGPSRVLLLGFLCILLAFSVPESGYSAMSECLGSGLKWKRADVLVMTLPATAVSALTLWLAVLAGRRDVFLTETQICAESD